MGLWTEGSVSIRLDAGVVRRGIIFRNFQEIWRISGRLSRSEARIRCPTSHSSDDPFNDARRAGMPWTEPGHSKIGLLKFDIYRRKGLITK